MEKKGQVDHLPKCPKNIGTLCKFSSQDVKKFLSKTVIFWWPGEKKLRYSPNWTLADSMASFFFKGSWSVCFFSFLTENFILETLSKVINMNKIAQLSILPFHVMPKCNLFEIPKYPKQSQVFRNMACRLFPDPVWKSTIVLTHLTIHKDPKGQSYFLWKKNASWFVGVHILVSHWNSGKVPSHPFRFYPFQKSRGSSWITSGAFSGSASGRLRLPLPLKTPLNVKELWFSPNLREFKQHVAEGKLLEATSNAPEPVGGGWTNHFKQMNLSKGWKCLNGLRFISTTT